MEERKITCRAEVDGRGKLHVWDYQERPGLDCGRLFIYRSGSDLQFIHSLRTPMYQYLDFFMARDPVLEDWELWESARYCFK
jgi:hypothetical protein